MNNSETITIINFYTDLELFNSFFALYFLLDFYNYDLFLTLNNFYNKNNFRKIIKYNEVNLKYRN